MVLTSNFYEWINLKHWLRLLPSTVAGHPLGLTVWRHYRLPNGRSLICPTTWRDLELPCALCRLLELPGVNRRSSRLPYLWARTYTSGIDRRNVQVGVQIIDLPLSCDEWITEATRYRVPYGNPYGDITHPLTGRDLFIESPPRKRQRYRTSFAPPSPLHEDPDVVTRWMSQRHDIVALFPTPSPEALAEIEAMAHLVRERLR